jgi:hypothetical protein
MNDSTSSEPGDRGFRGDGDVPFAAMPWRQR